MRSKKIISESESPQQYLLLQLTAENLKLVKSLLEDENYTVRLEILLK